jgi:hypothetical protein
MYVGEDMRVQGLGGVNEGKRPFRRPKIRGEDNIKTDLQEVGCGGFGLDRCVSE